MIDYIYIMELLLASENIIRDIKKKVDTLDRSLISHCVINNWDLHDNTISIIMTSSNRSKQTYFTLKTIAESDFKNIHIVLVDDSDIDPIDVNVLLKTFPFYIDFISIKRENKNWTNPVVNYNIGFKYVKGHKVVIQNAEVCHVGDALKMIDSIVEDDNYYAFDVVASKSYEINENIYAHGEKKIHNETTTDIYTKPDLEWFPWWYQHHTHGNRFLHFFTSMTRKSFEKIKEFSYDYTMGKDNDDDDFVLKVLSQNINLVCIENEKTGCGGIHLYHQIAYEGYCKNAVSNAPILDYKKKIWLNEKIYTSILDL